MNEPTVTLPVVAHMRVIDGKAVMVDAEYMTVSADDLAQFFLRAFHVNCRKIEELEHI